MADKCGQYYNGTNWQQWPQGGLTTADITLNTGIADTFITTKCSDDTLLIVCCKSNGSAGTNAKVIKITNSGVVTIGTIASAGIGNPLALPVVLLSKDNATIFMAFLTSYGSDQYKLYSFDKNFTAGEINKTTLLSNLGYGQPKFAIYKDLYIWVASGSTVSIYDYKTKALLGTNSLNINFVVSARYIICNVDNTLYLIGKYRSDGWILEKVEWLSDNNFALTHLTSNSTSDNYAKQLLIDKWGDLIILTNSGTDSTLLKYTTAGVLVDTKNLATASYNLNTDIEGNYFYYTALKEYQIDANASQGQPFTSVGYETRGTGNTGFGSNTTGYQPSVYN